MATLATSAPIQRLRRRFPRAPLRAAVEAAARFGYAARGAVYLSIGVVALLAALDLAPRAEGAIGALEAWGRWPAGILLLWCVGVGLYGFAAWRGLQSLFDADRRGTRPKAIAARVGQAISGIAYAAMAVGVFGLIDALEDLHESDDRESTRRAISEALALPMGDTLVTACGVFVMAAGVGSIVRAFTDHFCRDLDCSVRRRRWLGAIARVGYVGRGVALLPAGLLLARAGLQARASEARGLGGALDVLERGPWGDAVLILTALGLLAFGVFAVMEGWLRRMRIPDPT